MDLKYLLLCLLLYTGHAFSQTQAHPNKPLTSTNEAQEGKVYITYRANDSTDRISIFLINRSQEPIKVFGINRRILFIKEAKNEEGKWQRIDHYEGPVYCATGYGHFQIPKNTYTWQHLYTNDYAGSFETELRFSIRVQDSLIISAPISAKIDYNLFLMPQRRMIQQIDEHIMNGGLTDHQKRLLQFRKARIHFKDQDYLQSIATCRTLLQQDSHLNEVKFFLARAVVNKISTIKNVSEAEKYGLISAAINLWQEIPKKHENSDRALELIKVYMPYLPTKEQWKAVNTLECEPIGDEYQCFIGHYFNATTIIRYKD